MSYRSEIVGVASVGGICDSLVGYGVSIRQSILMFPTRNYTNPNVDLIFQTSRLPVVW